MDAPPPLVILPGLYSSVLGKKQARFAPNEWKIPTTLLFSLVTGNRGHRNLALPITWKKDEHGNDVQDEDDIEATDCLPYVQAKLLTLLDILNEKGLIELHKIPWDWRRSLEETEMKISAQLESICANDVHHRKATLLTHSTGCKLAWPTVSRNPHYFSSWINCAGCILASNVFLQEFQQGWKLGRVSLLGKETAFTLGSLYCYFRVAKNEGWVGAGDSEFITPDGKFLTHEDIDAYNIEDWKKFKLGVFGWENKEVTLEESMHVEKSLAAGKRFREKYYVRGGKPMDSSAFLARLRSEYDHLKIVCYGSASHQTHSAFEVNLENNTVDVTESKLTALGDGTLFEKNWQAVPGGLDLDIVMAEEGSTHVSLVNDKKLANLLVDTFFSKDEVSKASALAVVKSVHGK